MISRIFITFITLLTWGKPAFAQEPPPIDKAEYPSLSEFLTAVQTTLVGIQGFIFGIAASLAVLMIVIGGVYYMSQPETGKKIITASIIGLIIVAAAKLIFDLIKNLI